MTISLTSSCNKACYYCPTKKHHKPVDYKFPWLSKDPNEPIDESKRLKINAITAKDFFRWLDYYRSILDPREWLVEITGGEPGLHPEIYEIILGLAERGYRGIIKTNGSIYIIKTKSFPLIAAWHEGEGFPENYDQILIIKNPKDNWREKVDYCKENKIPYKTVLFDERAINGKVFDKALLPFHSFTGCLHINSMGQFSMCSRIAPKENDNIFDMAHPLIFDTISKECPKCKNLTDAEMFLTDYITF